MYAVDLPYPQIKVMDKNAKYLDLILQNYASSVSEFSAVSQYLYDELSILYEYKDVAKTLKGISCVEMHHLQILGQLIVLLGGKPGFYIDNKKKNYWSGKFINYDTSSITEIIALNIQGEKAAIQQYKKTIDQIQDKYIVDIINRIILDEELHIQILIDEYTKYSE